MEVCSYAPNLESHHQLKLEKLASFFLQRAEFDRTVPELEVKVNNFSICHVSWRTCVLTSMMHYKSTSRQALEDTPELLFWDIPRAAST